MRGVNKVILVGTLGKDPEVRFFPSGGSVANTSLATSESWKDKQTGEQKEKTEWHNLSFNGRLAEIAGEYLKKGSKVYVEGKLSTRKWQDQSGQDKYTTEVKVFEMQMLDSKPQGGQQQAPQQGGYQGAQHPHTQQGGYQQAQVNHAQQQSPQQNYRNNQNQSQSYGQPAQPAPDFDDD